MKKIIQPFPIYIKMYSLKNSTKDMSRRDIVEGGGVGEGVGGGGGGVTRK